MDTCAKHPRYKAIRKPRAACDACWNMYLKKQSKPRMERRPTQWHKDEKKYDRKRDKKDWETSKKGCE
jgi:hypothetical protein